MAAATSAGPATSRTLLLIGELKVVPPQQSSSYGINSTVRLRLTCTTLNVRLGIEVHNKMNKEQETLKTFVKNI